MDRPINSPDEGPFETGRRPEKVRHQQPSDHRARVALMAALEDDIIPRLMNAHRPPMPLQVSADSLPVAAACAVDAGHVSAFVEIALHGEAERALDYVLGLRDAGATVESLYLDLLTPAARRIGAMWEADTCDFVLVTLAVLRIQQVMYDLSPDFVREGAEPSSRRALVVPMPGSHHTLGAAMVADFFRRDGWDVISTHDLNRADMLRVVRQEWIDVLALSMSTPSQMANAATLIADVRRTSSNRGILVMVGGPLALSVPDLAARVGADVGMMDARQAVDVAGRAVPVRGVAVAN